MSIPPTSGWRVKAHRARGVSEPSVGDILSREKILRKDAASLENLGSQPIVFEDAVGFADSVYEFSGPELEGRYVEEWWVCCDWSFGFAVCGVWLGVCVGHSGIAAILRGNSNGLSIERGGCYWVGRDVRHCCD